MNLITEDKMGKVKNPMRGEIVDQLISELGGVCALQQKNAR